jgi:hypothetical protein
MKPSRTLVGIISALTLLFPTVAPAATTTDLNNQLLVALLEQLIQVLQTELQQLLALHQTPLPTHTTTFTDSSGNTLGQTTIAASTTKNNNITADTCPPRMKPYPIQWFRRKSPKQLAPFSS